MVPKQRRLNCSEATAASPAIAGTLDPSFGEAGSARSENHSVSAYHFTELGVDSTGNIFAGAGITGPLVSRYRRVTAGANAVTRFTPDGRPDATFGVGGIVPITRSQAGWVNIWGIAAQPDGKAIVSAATSAFDGHPVKRFLVRLNRDGSFDPSFGSAGEVILGFNTFPGVAYSADGRILVARYPIPEMTLEARTTAGMMDTSFGNNGVAMIPRPKEGGMVLGFIVAPDSTIYAYGQCLSDVGTIGRFITRIDATGTPIATFAGGTATIFVPNHVLGGEINGPIAITHDGKIVLGERTNTEFIVTRLNADGTRDTTFGGPGGFVSLAQPLLQTYTLATQPEDGKIIIGTHQADAGNVIMRLNVDGSLDTSFGTAGTGFVPIADAYPHQRGMIVSGDRLVTSGLTVAAVFLGPVGASDDMAATSRNMPVNIDALANDSSDPTIGGALTIEQHSQPAHGTVVRDGDGLRYTPEPDFIGDDRFEYTAGDDRGASASATVFVTVRPSRLEPRPVNDGVVVFPNTTTAVRVLDNDAAHVEVGGELAIESFTQPVHGSVTHSGSELLYTPQAGFAGSDSFTYIVRDSHGQTASAAVFAVVAYPPPITERDVVVTRPGTDVTIDVLANDRPDPAVGGSLTLVSLFGPFPPGSARIDAGKIVYSPPAAITGPGPYDRTRIYYKVRDQNGTPETGWVDVTVTESEPPVANMDSITVAAGSTDNLINVLANDTDPEGDPRTVTAVGTPVHGVATLTAGEVHYTPNAGFHGHDGFTYTISDGQGNSATATIEITIVNQPPLANNDSVSVTQGSSDNPVDLLSNDTDPEGDPRIVTAVGTPAHGVATLTAGEVHYTPSAGFHGSDTFTYTISDGQGNAATGTVLVTITPASGLSAVPPAAAPPRPILFRAPATLRAATGWARVSFSLQPVADVRTFRVILRATRGSFVLRAASRIVRGNRSSTLVVTGSAASIRAALAGLRLRLPSGRAWINASVIGGVFVQRAAIRVLR